MTRVTRRGFLATAAALGAAPLWAGKKSKLSPAATSHERRDLYPEGVASGDPQPDSVLLWTRRPYESGTQGRLLVEVAEDDTFKHVIASTHATVSASSDWTCRVLAGNLEPATVYWYRFTDEMGHMSRVGRTITAPAEND